MRAADNMITDENARVAAFKVGLERIVNASAMMPFEVVPILGAMVAIARHFPCSDERVPMGFFDLDRELTAHEWRGFAAALASLEQSQLHCLPHIVRRRPEEGDVSTARAGGVSRTEGVLLDRWTHLDREPGLLERLRRLVIDALHPWVGGGQGPNSQLSLALAVLSLASESQGASAQPAAEIEALLSQLVPRRADRVVYCAYEGAAGIALRLAAEGARRIAFDLRNEGQAQLVYHLALACELPLAIRILNPALEMPGGNDSPADAAIAVPPIGIRYPEADALPHLPKDRSADALHLLSLLRRTDGPIACLVPDGFLSRSTQSERFFREQLVVENGLTTVASLPRGVFQRAAVSMSLLYRYAPARSSRGRLQFVDLRRNGDVKQCFAGLTPPEVADLLRGQEATERSRSVGFAELTENDFNLQVERYVLAPDALGVRAALSRTKTVALGDVAEIFRPQATPGSSGDEVIFREVAASDIDAASGVVRLPGKQIGLNREVAARARRGLLEPGDLIVSIKGRVGVVGRIEEVELGGEPWVPGQSFAVLRARRSSTITDPRVLHRYLTSDLGRKALQSLAGGSTVPFIQIGDLRRLEVPVPTPADLQALVEGRREIDELNEQVILLQERMMEIEESLWPMNLVSEP